MISLDLTRIAPSYAALEAALTALMRDCLLADAIPVIAELDELTGGEADPGARQHLLARILENAASPVAVTSKVPGLDVKVRGRRILLVACPVPETAARRLLWSAPWRGLAGFESGIDELALRYRMGAGGINAGATSARSIRDARGGSAALEAHDLQEGIRNNIAEQMGELAQRTEVKQRWEDLVLPPDTHEDVKNLVARVRFAHQVYEKWGFKQKMPRGIGVAALFSGPPGTGKTMVAGLLARELDLELYQVDLSKVVSKWVGETEKQLSPDLRGGDAGHALLLFDEADSLFAKRTEVKSSVDRYANLEVNYLLQRIESFGGVTILTTNLDFEHRSCAAPRSRRTSCSSLRSTPRASSSGSACSRRARRSSSRWRSSSSPRASRRWWARTSAMPCSLRRSWRPRRACRSRKRTSSALPAASTARWAAPCSGP
ncbi:MAG: ATP-binding protein [Myxococcales bacterium]|nr:ATP-binding protein [Myxococcales bacterium]